MKCLTKVDVTATTERPSVTASRWSSAIGIPFSHIVSLTISSLHQVFHISKGIIIIIIVHDKMTEENLA